MEKDIFISHSSEDKPFVRKLIASLEKYGLSIWVDEGEILPGDRIRDKINYGIASSKFMFVVLSERSIVSPWVQVELDSAMIKELDSREVVVIPLLIGNIEILQIPVDMRGKLFSDFRSDADFDKSSEKLSSSVCKRLNINYEATIISMDFKIDILEADGSKVLYSKNKKFRVLADELKSMNEEYFADGEIDFLRVEPGEMIGVEYSLHRYILEVGFGRVLKKGEIFEQCVESLYKDSFTLSREYWQIEHVVPARNHTYTFIFPQERPYLSIEIFTKDGIKLSREDVDVREFIDNGRHAFSFSMKKIPINKASRIYWDW